MLLTGPQLTTSDPIAPNAPDIVRSERKSVTS